jgi:nucleotide-binding universal stress UspA family protein
VTKLRSRPKLDTSSVGEISVNDQRSEQAVSVLQVHDTGRQIVMEVFKGVGLASEKTDLILTARSRIADQWGKAKQAALLIGQTLLGLSRALTEEEYRHVLTGSDRLFEFSAALATKFRRAAELAEQLRMPFEQLPGYTTLYDLACLGPDGIALARDRDLIRPQLRRQDVVALRQELRAHRISATPSVADEVEATSDRIDREAIQRQYDALVAERTKLFERLQQVQADMLVIEGRLRLAAGYPVIDEGAA